MKNSKKKEKKESAAAFLKANVCKTISCTKVYLQVHCCCFFQLSCHCDTAKTKKEVQTILEQQQQQDARMQQNHNTKLTNWFFSFELFFLFFPFLFHIRMLRRRRNRRRRTRTWTTTTTTRTRRKEVLFALCFSLKTKRKPYLPPVGLITKYTYNVEYHCTGITQLVKKYIYIMSSINPSSSHYLTSSTWHASVSFNNNIFSSTQPKLFCDSHFKLFWMKIRMRMSTGNNKHVNGC